MDLITNALCTLDELKDFMGIDKTETNAIRDNNLILYINGLSQDILKRIGRNIFAKDYVEKHKGTDTGDLVLNNYPINSVTSVEYVFENETYRTLDNYEYDLDEESGILSKDDGWLIEGYSLRYMSDKIDFTRRHIRVTYNAGYIDVPFDLKLLCMQHLSDLYVMDNGKGGTLKSYKISDVALEYKDDIKFSESQLKIIDHYKEVRF